LSKRIVAVAWLWIRQCLQLTPVATALLTLVVAIGFPERSPFQLGLIDGLVVGVAIATATTFRQVVAVRHRSGEVSIRSLSTTQELIITCDGTQADPEAVASWLCDFQWIQNISLTGASRVTLTTTPRFPGRLIFGEHLTIDLRYARDGTEFIIKIRPRIPGTLNDRGRALDDAAELKRIIVERCRLAIL
jgi:hypothetical protein